MNKSFQHISFGKSFVQPSVASSYSYWKSNGNCCEKNNLVNCNK